ncbi:MAG: hypothetical protein IPP07_23875 [Holophagales bacterium]|nr:hypothetical protein [Holophagales bacterium]
MQEGGTLEAGFPLGADSPGLRRRSGFGLGFRYRFGLRYRLGFRLRFGLWCGLWFGFRFGLRCRLGFGLGDRFEGQLRKRLELGFHQEPAAVR